MQKIRNKGWEKKVTEIHEIEQGLIMMGKWNWKVKKKGKVWKRIHGNGNYQKHVRKQKGILNTKKGVKEPGKGPVSKRREWWTVRGPENW